jgi:hypothetical protein
VVAGAVGNGSRRAYSSYWKRLVEIWGDRRLDEVTPSEIERLAQQIKANVVSRRNARGGRSAAELFIAALRCLYKRAVADGYLTAADDPAQKVQKPRRLPSTRRAIADARLAEINQVAGTTGDDPDSGGPPRHAPEQHNRTCVRFSGGRLLRCAHCLTILHRQ